MKDSSSSANFLGQCMKHGRSECDCRWNFYLSLAFVQHVTITATFYCTDVRFIDFLQCNNILLRINSSESYIFAMSFNVEDVFYVSLVFLVGWKQMFESENLKSNVELIYFWYRTLRFLVRYSGDSFSNTFQKIFFVAWVFICHFQSVKYRRAHQHIFSHKIF